MVEFTARRGGGGGELRAGAARRRSFPRVGGTVVSQIHSLGWLPGLSNWAEGKLVVIFPSLPRPVLISLTIVGVGARGEKRRGGREGYSHDGEMGVV